jgi:hypothetical protein
MVDEPPTIDAAFAPARAAAVYTVDLDGEAVLLDEDRNRLHHLNRSAALLWACFDGDASIAVLVREISEELNLPEEELLVTSLEVVRDLAAEGLLAGIACSEHDAGDAV